ncbi:uncharacterized protein LOC103358397 isoform X4 [Stegastes partitus]|uniref:Ubiquitin carboxyl-terminal hydrolase n=1 Tax=Stegastes partitus TaxID=144197 RepID=A0A9Y4MU07_9TELE|nr:PREDICTED: uncharacterized protein LOC103358397 isoform X4 [Stegastes partitus]
MSWIQGASQSFYSTVTSWAAHTKYHGLLNQGATCYLNSVLQVLFMTEDFREAVKRYTDENPDTQLIDHHLNALFSDLRTSTAYTYNITRTLGIDKVYEQRDAAEYFERILRMTSEDASQIFHGLLSQKTTCRKCHADIDRDEAFWHLPLALVDSCSDCYSVVDGVKEFFKVSVFCGEDQMYCDPCDAKVDADTQYVMKHHPEVLILLLKRFDFSYRHMSYVKINCDVDVPSVIQIPERQTYELYAFVDHYGDLRSGHYSATIKDEGEDRWYKFNDTSVTLCHDQPFQSDDTMRSHTAYLLFYRKKKDADTQDNMSTNGGVSLVLTENHYQCEDAEKFKKQVEGEVDVEMGDDKAVTASADESDPVYRPGSRSRLDRKHEQQRKEERRDVKGNRKEKKYERQEAVENPDNGNLADAQRNKGKNPFVHLIDKEKKEDVEIIRYSLKKDRKCSSRDERIDDFTKSKPFDNQECRRESIDTLGRHFEDKKDSKRDEEHDRRRESTRKCSESVKSKDSGGLDERIGQKKKQAKEKEEKTAHFHTREHSGLIENQERGSEQQVNVHNKGGCNQPEGSVEVRGPAKTRKRTRSSILSCIKKGETKAEETSNCSQHDQNTDSLTKNVSNLKLAELAVPETKKRKTLGCFSLFSRSVKSPEQSGEED